VNSGSLNDMIYSPKLSAVFGPWARTEYFVNYGYGFHSNDARGTVITVDPNDPLTPADPVTPLAKTRGAEIGVKTEAIPGLQSTLSLWQLELDSELLFIGDAGTTEASRPSLRRGMEWSNHWIVKPWLLLDLDVSLSRARFTDEDPAGDYIPGSIERVVSGGVSVADVGPWSASVIVRYFGPRPLIEDNSVRSSATLLTNLRAGYRIDKRWNVILDVFNLFDREASDIEYLYESQLTGEPGPVEDIHFHPVEPRNLRLTLSGRF
jgi:outer membrane receptor protein involved in Fe transport